MKTVLVDWNLIPYAEAWQRQTEWFDTLSAQKRRENRMKTVLLYANIRTSILWDVAEKKKNMLLNDDQLKAIQATLFHIDRGGISRIMVPDS